MLDFSRTIDLGAENTSIPVVGLPVPQSLTDVAKALAGWRFDNDWDELDYVQDVSSLGVPMPIVHGDDDETVPIESNRGVAEAAPENVRLEEFEDTGHIEAWNADPERYERALREFLAVELG